MNSFQFRDLCSNYVSIGSWLDSCSNLPDELLKPHIIMLRKSIKELLDNVDAIDNEINFKQ